MLRRGVLLACTLLGVGCADRTNDLAAPSGTGVSGQVEDVARAIALGMADPTARHMVRDAMRASPLTDHKLSFREYAASAAAEPLLRAAAAATGYTLEGLRARIAALPDLDFSLASQKQRVSWRGGSDYLVTWMLGNDNPTIAFDRNGARTAFDISKPRPPEAVFFIESAERKSARLDPPIQQFGRDDPGSRRRHNQWQRDAH